MGRGYIDRKDCIFTDLGLIRAEVSGSWALSDTIEVGEGSLGLEANEKLEKED